VAGCPCRSQTLALAALRTKAEALEELCEQKDVIIEELMARLRSAGVSEAR
jgi:hypothetical protein